MFIQKHRLKGYLDNYIVWKPRDSIHSNANIVLSLTRYPCKVQNRWSGGATDFYQGAEATDIRTYKNSK
jgi:hypothetical protein